MMNKINGYFIFRVKKVLNPILKTGDKLDFKDNFIL